MKVKKLTTDCRMPERAYNGDAGADFFSPEMITIQPNDWEQIKLGFAIEIESDEVAIMSERSGMAIHDGVTSIGNIIDSGYRGECSLILHNLGNLPLDIYKGDKIGQIVVLKLGNRNIIEVEKLSPSQRGEKAHNSSGK